MRTSLALFFAGFVCMGMTLSAADRLTFKAEPMLMAYYTPERNVTLLAEPASERARVTRIESKLPPTNWRQAMSQTFTLSSTSTQMRLNADTVKDGENEMIARTFIPSGIPMTQRKFSFSSLMEGSIYDFRKANGMRVEVGPPVPVKSEAFANNKYEEPFCVSFWLRFKI